jgi:hypothetical protein
MRGSVVKRGRTWSHVVDVGRDPTTGRCRQRWKGGLATKHQAEDALAFAVAGRLAGAIEPTGVTVAEHLERWFSAHTPTAKPTTANSYGEQLRWWVIPSLGSLRLADVTPLHVQTLYAALLSSRWPLKSGPVCARLDEEADPMSKAFDRYANRWANDFFNEAAGLLPVAGVAFILLAVALFVWS